jgi:hypothetical protein
MEPSTHKKPLCAAQAIGKCDPLLVLQVHAYNVAADSWSELQELPFPICHASPVAVRVSSMMSGYAT